jgi:hypothetical protein
MDDGFQVCVLTDFICSIDYQERSFELSTNNCGLPLFRFIDFHFQKL